MTDTLSAVAELGRQGFLVGFFVFLRVGAAMAVLPAFGEQSVPQRVRLVLALCFTAIIAPAVTDQVAVLVHGGQMIGVALVTEVLAGLALGIALRLFVLALQMAGSIAAQSTSLSQIFGAAGVDPAPAIGHLMVVSGLALAVMLGLHVRVAEVLILSYDLLPAGGFPDAGVLAEWGVGRTARAFALAFTLSAPFVIASLIYNVALGVINRAMPQLMVAFVGAPAITAGGLILLFLTLPTLLSVWTDQLSGFLENPFGVP